MEFKQFKKQLKEDLENQIAGRSIDADFTLQKIRKPNQSYEAITVTKRGGNVGININIDNLFDELEHGTDYDEILNQTIHDIIIDLKNAPSIDISRLATYELMKDTLTMQVIPRETNRELLAKVPFKKIEDMAVIFRFQIENDGENISSVVATDQMLLTMGITPKLLYADALKSAPRIKPMVIKSIEEVMAKILNTDELDDIVCNADRPRMYVATVEDETNGACVLAYPGFLETASERIGGDFYVIPSSIHEVLLIPDDGFIRLPQLEGMLREVNENELSPKDKLTDNVYHYDSVEKQFEMGTQYVNRQEKE